MQAAVAMDRRVIGREEVRQMDLPVHFWPARLDNITAQICGEHGSLADFLEDYLRSWPRHRQEGRGLLLSGPNGCGKTSAAAALGKAVKARGETVFFVAASDVMRHKIEGTLWDETTYWDWCREVDVLILDDLGKGSDGSGYAAVMWDELFRYRLARRYVTIITTNLALRGADAADGIGLDTVLKRSTVEALKEMVTPLDLDGVNRRDVR